MTKLQILIRDLGVTNSYKGYAQLMVAIELTKSDPAYLKKVTTLLYPAVAEATNSSYYSVERNLRTIINACWTKGNQELVKEMSGYNMIHKPAAKDFIGMIARYEDQYVPPSVVMRAHGGQR